MVEKDEQPTRTTMFMATHKRRKNGRLIDQESAQKIEMMQEKLDNLSNSVEQSGGRIAWKGDVYSQVMGPEAYGHVHGLGLDPTLTMLQDSSSSHQQGVSVNGISNDQVHQLQEQMIKMQQIQAQLQA